MDHGQRARVILIGGDAHRLRSLRLFLDQLGVFEPVAIATGGAGLNALARQPWAVAVVVDDLYDMPPEALIQAGRAGGFSQPFVALVVGQDRVRVSQLYAAGAAEVLDLGISPMPEVARAIARAMERQQLLDRIAVLEAQLAQSRAVDEETGLYPAGRFDEDWRNEQIRAKRRGGELTILSVRLETVPELYGMSPRDRLTALRSAARAIRASLREGDVASHDGGGVFRVLMPDAGSLEASETMSRLTAGIRSAFTQSGVTGQAAVSIEESFGRPV